MQDALIFHFT